MTILRDLLNAGVISGDAKILDDEYSSEPEFLDGLEQIARVMVVKDSPGLIPPLGEPWKSIHAEMLQTPDFDLAVDRAIGALQPAVQAAIMGAIQARMIDLQQWLQTAQNQGKKRKSADYIKVLSNLGYTFRFNQCTHDIEINGERMTDAMSATIRSKLRDYGVPEVAVAEDAYLANAWQNRYHPIRDYLTSVKWQGEDMIARLAEYFVDERGVIDIWLKRWLVGACARVMAREQNRMLILDGVQGLGKDYFVRWLCSPLPEYYYEGAIMPEDKDHRLRLLSVFIWDANEVGSTTRRADREALKSFLTINTVRERKPYGHFDIQGPALTSFIGTVNNEGGILNDPTGHRRFMVTNLKEIDWNYTTLDVDQIWAQAFTLYLGGEPWQLKGEELRIANEINEEYQAIDLVEETLKKIFVIEPGDTQLFLSTVEIIEALKDPMRGNLRAGTEVDTRRMASALTRLGLGKSSVKKIYGRPVRGYFGIRFGP